MPSKDAVAPAPADDLPPPPPPAENNNKNEPVKKNAGNASKQPNKKAAPVIPLSRPPKRRSFSRDDKSATSGMKSQDEVSKMGGAGDDKDSGNFSGGTATQLQNSQYSSYSRKKFLWYEKNRDNTFCILVIMVIIVGILLTIFGIVCLATDFFAQWFYSEYK